MPDRKRVVAVRVMTVIAEGASISMLASANGEATVEVGEQVGDEVGVGVRVAVRAGAPNPGEGKAAKKLREEIALCVSENEKAFLDLLKRFHITDSCPTKKDLRVAGGWVRDKVLAAKEGKGSEKLCQSPDLDIALEDVSGEVFAKAFERIVIYECRFILLEEKKLRVKSVVVKSNPAKSKHLETAVMALHSLGLSIDFVNLRSETYASDSRVPTMQFGTPLEDAERRDFTVNAMFYNINEECIEDYLGTGLNDLEARVLRTPLPPLQTFKDDPLRVLRAARFLGKLPGFRVEEEIDVAAGGEDIRRALVEKVTVDRSRQEVAKIFESSRGLEAPLTAFFRWQTFTALAGWTPQDWPQAPASIRENFVTPERARAALAADATLELLRKNVAANADASAGVGVEVGAEGRVEGGPIVAPFFKGGVENGAMEENKLFGKGYRSYGVRGAAVFACLFHGLRQFHLDRRTTTANLINTPGLLETCGINEKVDKNLLTLPQYILTNYRSKNVGDAVRSLHALADLFDLYFNSLETADRETTSATRDLLVAALTHSAARQWWTVALVVAVSLRHFRSSKSRDAEGSGSTCSWGQFEVGDEIPAVLSLVEKTLAAITRFDLATVWSFEPSLTGNDWRAHGFTKAKPGKALGDLMRAQKKWQVDNFVSEPEKRAAQLPKMLEALKKEFPQLL